MSVNNPKRRIFGFENLALGMNSGLDADLILDNQAALLVNATVRGGKPKTRPGWDRIALSGDEFPEDGLWQGATIYQGTDGQNFIVASIGGEQFRISPDGSVLDITIPGNPNNPNRKQVWFAQAAEYLIMQDGQEAPWVWSGGSAIRLGPGQLPCGTVMTYGMGRVWIASVDRKSFVAGDIIYGDGTTGSVLGFTENDYLNEGGSFGVPFTAGRINAMKFLANIDTSLGQGPLQVFCDEAVFSVDAPVNREIWKDVTYPIQTFSLLSSGAVSQDSAVLVNNDIWVRSSDGIRSLVIARREFGSWGNTPMSQEMEYILKHDTGFLLQYTSGTLFDNRLIFTCSPVEAARGTVHRGLIVMDFHQVSSLFEKKSPVYDGVWSGLQILQILTGKFEGSERCFVFALNSDDEIELWEITKDALFDNGDQRIEWKVQMKSYDANNPAQYKRLLDARLWPQDIAGQVDFDLYWTSDLFPTFEEWDSVSQCAQVENCGELVAGCLAPQMFRAHPSQRIIFQEAPSEPCQEPMKKRARVGWEFQPMLIVTGHATLNRFTVGYQDEEEDLGQHCPRGEPECFEVSDCDEHAQVFTYSIGGS